MMEYVLPGRKQRNYFEHVGIFIKIIVAGMLEAHRNVALLSRALQSPSILHVRLGLNQ